MKSKDEIAVERYGNGFTYDRLSAFGKRAVDRVLAAESYAATLPKKTATEEVALRQSNTKLAEQLEIVSQENEDLWEQLNEARAELEELRSKFNPPLSS